MYSKKVDSMKKLKFHFYNGRNPDAASVHKIILWRSDPHTHIELENEDGVSFSSELGVGPRFKNITYSHPDRWTTVVLWVTDVEYVQIWYRATLLVEMRNKGLLKYDNRGIAGALFSGRHTIWAYFCSEAVYSVVAPEVALPELNYKLWPEKLLEVIKIVASIRITMNLMPE